MVPPSVATPHADDEHRELWRSHSEDEVDLCLSGPPYTLWLCQNSHGRWMKMAKDAIEIVDFPISMVIFHSYVTNYQRVDTL